MIAYSKLIRKLKHKIEQITEILKNYFASLTRCKHTVTVRGTVQICKKNELNVTEKEVKKTFEQWERAGWGRYISGRHTSPCRFVANVPLREIGRLSGAPNGSYVSKPTQPGGGKGAIVEPAVPGKSIS